MKSRINLTKRTLDTLPTPSPGKRKDYYDSQTRGLLIQVSWSGSKTFYVRRKVRGQSERFLIGRYPDLSLDDARGKAAEINAAIAKGDMPHERLTDDQEETTLGELFQSYIQGHARPRCSSSDEIEACFRRYLSDWKDRKFSTINRSEAQTRLNHIAHEHGPYCANRSLTDMRAAINWCIRSGLVATENPWAGIPRYRTSARERFIRPDEFARFLRALTGSHNPTFRDYIYISLLTGARRSNVLSMCWDDIDLTLAIWRIPKTKNGSSQTVPLSSLAVQLLAERSRTRTSKWVFSGRGELTHYSEPKTSWNTLLRVSGISDLRLHDLRRTLGSYMAMGNSSLHIIGSALGHKSVPATQIYARLTCDPVRQAMEKAQADMLAAAGLDCSS